MISSFSQEQFQQFYEWWGGGGGWITEKYLKILQPLESLQQLI